MLTHTSPIFADVRTYWSADAVAKAAGGCKLEGYAAKSNGVIHLINSGAACLDANAQAVDANGNKCMKPWYEITNEDQKNILANTTWPYADLGSFRGGGYSSCFVTTAETSGITVE